MFKLLMSIGSKLFKLLPCMVNGSDVQVSQCIKPSKLGRAVNL